MRGPITKWGIGLVLLLPMAASTTHEVEVRDLPSLRRRMGIAAYDAVPGIRERLARIKIAVLDKGFGNPETLEKDLPKSNFTLVGRYEREFIERHRLGSFEGQQALDATDDHGRQMAQLAYAMTGYRAEGAPQFYLLNANGLTNFSRAVRWAIENRVDIILFSQNWEYGGNFDGRGFINRIVDEAVRAGILWINAAGNYGGRVHNAAITTTPAGWVALGEDGAGLRLRSRLDRNPVRIVLSWNAYTEEETTGTDKDLDLLLYDPRGNVVARGELRQVVKREGVERAEGQTYVPREILETRLARSGEGFYRIRVVARGGSFQATRDRLRITVLPGRQPQFDPAEGRHIEAVELVDASRSGEIMVPADHPGVITVGDLSPASAQGPTEPPSPRAKPDIVLERSDVEFTDGEGSSGTSNAAALFAGIVAVMKAHRPELNRESLIAMAPLVPRSSTRRPGEAQGIEDLGVEAVREAQGPVIEALDRLLGGRDRRSPILLAGRHRNGPFIVALDRSPLELSHYYRYLPRYDRDPENFEIFLAATPKREGGYDVWAYWREKQRPEGQPEQEWERHLRQSPQSYVQVVRAKPRPAPDANEPQLPFWRTPEPSR